MSEMTEPSYYEIALTNRQVVVAFVILLSMVLAIFLCGVWVGRGGQSELRLAANDAAALGGEPEALANMEEFKFFAENGEGEADLDKPNLDQLIDKPRKDTTLAQDVGASSEAAKPAAETSATETVAAQEAVAQKPAPAPARQPKPATSAPGRAQTVVPPAPVPVRQAKPSAPSQAPQRPMAADAQGFVVQVFSTHDEPQARKVLKQLTGLGHQAFLSSVNVGGQSMFRVRIGPFAERSAADRVKGQVREQLKLDPWVTAASN